MTIMITTPHQRDQLPPGVIVRSVDGTVACRHTSGVGTVFGDDRPFPWERLTLPLMIILNEDLSPAIDPDLIAAVVLETAQQLGLANIHGTEADILADAVCQVLRPH